METTQEIIIKIDQLPENLKSEAKDFIDFFIERNNKKASKKRMKPGDLKGTFSMSDDFDAPLEDFKDYM